MNTRNLTGPKTMPIGRGDERILLRATYKLAEHMEESVSQEQIRNMSRDVALTFEISRYTNSTEKENIDRKHKSPFN